MKKVFSYSILAILVLAGCQVKELEVETTNEQDVLPVLESKTFVAIIEDDSAGNKTRTTLDNSGNVLWKQGDQVSIFAGSTVNERYQVTDESEGKTSAALNKISGAGSGSALDNNVAFYPYASTATIAKSGSNYVISGIALPATQTYAAGGFGNGAFPMAAITNSTAEMNLSFKIVLGGLKLQLKGTATITSITVTGNNDEVLCGDAGVTVSTESNPSINLTNAAAKTVTLDCGAGVTLNSETATSFIIALPPITMTGGFTVTVTDTEGKEMEIKSTRSQTITRSSLLKMPAVTYVGTHANIAYLSSDFLPNEVDKTSITEAHFYVSDSTTTGTTLFNPGDYAPVYFEMDGSIAKCYTAAKKYKLADASFLFDGWSNLEELDMSPFDTRGCTSFERTFRHCERLKRLSLNNIETGSANTMREMFAFCHSLETLDLSNFNTSNVGSMWGMFVECSSLKSLDLRSFNTSNVTNMICMFGSYEINGCSSLESLDLSGFDVSQVQFMNGMFQGCSRLKSVNLSGWNTSKVVTMDYMFNYCNSLQSVDLSSFNTSKVGGFFSMFRGCRSLTELDLSNFDTSSVVNMECMFLGCDGLVSLNISSFSASADLTNISMFLGDCARLQRLDLGDFVLTAPVLSNDSCSGLAALSKYCSIRCSADMKSYLQSSSTQLKDEYINWLNLNEDFPPIEDRRDPSLYYSSDYSMNGKVRVVQKAAIGNGVEIVFMGDAYSDRLIADGTYDKDMEIAIDAIFEKEPMKSFKNLFNIYIIYLVSDNETISGRTALSVRYGVPYSDAAVAAIKYAVTTKQVCKVATNIICHDTNALDNSLGTTYSFDMRSADQFNDYGDWQMSFACTGRWGDESTFKNTVVHEFGHTFAKLKDEGYDYIGQIPDSQISAIVSAATQTGSAKNIDFTNIDNAIKWSRFIGDSRYNNEQLGAYEGACYYSMGVWRPTFDSIMGSADVGTTFNAPSREAIYYRIHKLAYGDSWQYDYETFVQQDLKNIPQAAPAPAPAKRVSSAKVNRKHVFKIDESITEDGKKMVTIIQN